MTPTDPTALNAALAADGTFRAELLAAASSEEAAALAVRKGWAVTAADIEKLAGEFMLPGGELSDADLEHVNGGASKAGDRGMLSSIIKKQKGVQDDVVRNIR